MTDKTPPPELSQEQLESIEAYEFGVRFDTTGRPAIVKVPKDIAMHEIIDLAFWIMRPDGGLRDAIAAMDARRSPLEVQRAPIVGLDGRPVS
jgi:hypothetical protein